MNDTIKIGTFVCSRCGKPLRCIGGNDAFSCANGHTYAIEHGVLDLYVAPPGCDLPAPEGNGQHSVILSAIGELMGIEVDSLKKAGLMDPVKKTGNSFFDMEEEIFVERFFFVNKSPRISIQDVYSTGAMNAGINWIAIRIRNDSAFPISSNGPHPVMISYHLLSETNEILQFEGLRSPLPVDVQPGQAITMHLQVEIGSALDGTHIEILPVQENIRWVEEDSVRLPIRIVAAHQPPANDGARPFSEIIDDELAVAFLEKQLGTRPQPVIAVEVGGGSTSLLPRWARENGRDAALINNDISIRILRLAALKAMRDDDRLSLQARFDANAMPIVDNALDAVLFCRSLHHFENPSEVLTECRRVLKPDGLLILVCEPVNHAYDDLTKDLIRAGVNEQAFPLDGYIDICGRAGFEPADISVDWGFSLKGAFRKGAKTPTIVTKAAAA